MQAGAMADTAATLGAAEGNAQVLPEDVDSMLASILPQQAPAPKDGKNRRKAPRFRVKWHVDILVNGRNVYHGFINDISTSGASVFLANNVHPLNPTLRIHVPPLSLTSQPHYIEVTGKTIYMVFDGDKQLYRAAISFSHFRTESDQAYLEERLNKHHAKIPEQ